MNNKRKIADPLLLLLLCLVMITPFLRNNTLYTGVDMGYHLNRAYEEYMTLKSGHIFNLINTFSLNHVGMPTNMVYGFIYLYPLAFWMLIVHNKITAVYLGIALILFITAIIAYWVGNKFWKYDRNKSLAFAILFTFSTYTFDIFWGSFSLAQASAEAFLPLVAYGTYSIFWRKSREWMLLSLGMTLTIYCHLVSTFVYSSLIMIIIIIAMTTQSIHKESVFAFLKAVVLTIATTAFYWGNLLTIYLKNPAINTPSSSGFYGEAPIDFIVILVNSICGITLVTCVLISLLNWHKLANQSKLVMLVASVYIIISLNIFDFGWKIVNETPVKVIQGVIRFRPMISFLLIVFVVSSSSSVFKNYSRYLMLISALIGLTWLSSSYNFFTNRAQLTTVTDFYRIHKKDPFENYKITNNDDFYHIVEMNYDGVGCLDYWPNQALKDKSFLMSNNKGQIVVNANHNSVFIRNREDQKTRYDRMPFLIYNGISYRITNIHNKVISWTQKDNILYVKHDFAQNGINIRVELNNIQKILLVVSFVAIIFMLVKLLPIGRKF